MSLNQYTQKIDRYLSKNEGLPIVVDVQNEADQIELVQHYHVGKNELITASKYCAPDEMPRYEELLNDLATLDGVLIVTGTTSYLKLDGEQELQRFMRKLLSMSIKGHVKTVHDFKFCSCGSCAVDGGHDYLRRCGNREDWEELSEAEKVEGNDALT